MADSPAVKIWYDGNGERHTLNQVGWIDPITKEMVGIDQPADGTVPVFMEVPNGAGL